MEKNIMRELMVKNEKVLSFSLQTGECIFYKEEMLPCALKANLLKEDGFEARIQNISVLKEWCAGRTLSMSKQQAKKICNALLIQQDDSVDTKSKLALMYKCLTLDDSFWVRKMGENIDWEEVNLFNNKSENLLTPVSLKGEVGTLFNGKLKNGCDLGVDGTFSKSWIRDIGTLYLLKADDTPTSSEVIKEVCASRVLDCFVIPHADYDLSDYEGLRVSKTPIFTSGQYGLLKYRELKKYFQRVEKDAITEVKNSPFAQGYYKMCVFSYLIGNEDLHDGNWGFLQDSDTGEIVTFAPLYDFNYAFGPDYLNGRSGDHGFIPESKYVDENGKIILDSARLEDEYYEIVFEKTMKEAAQDAMKHTEIRQILPLSPEMFPSREYYDEFLNRAAELNLQLFVKEIVKKEEPQEEKKESLKEKPQEYPLW